MNFSNPRKHAICGGLKMCLVDGDDGHTYVLQLSSDVVRVMSLAVMDCPGDTDIAYDHARIVSRDNDAELFEQLKTLLLEG